MKEMDGARHDYERGHIIRTLMEDYTSEMTAVRTLMLALDAVNVPMSPDGMSTHLVYLAEQGYVRIWRNRDMPGWRSDRLNAGNASEIRFVKLTPRGMQLLDGDIPADPKVVF